MKLVFIFAVLFCGTVYAQLDLATPCNPDECVLPDCRCASTSFIDSIPLERTPQLVTLTFDDAVTELIYDMVMPYINGRINPDGCPAQATFYVSHEYTDYSKVHEAWADGHEIALHSISHSPSTGYWSAITYEELLDEFGGQREMMAHFAEIDIDDMQGIRVPLFQLSGNQTFQAIKELGMTCDNSWPTQQMPGLWPYSLDFASSQDCPIGLCPTASIPNVWVNPLVNWRDTNNVPCAMVDACQNVPSDDVDALVEWMKENFHKTYDTNRAPFGVYLHAAWFLRDLNHLIAYDLFLDYLEELPDVYLVSSSRVIEYIRNPRPIGEDVITTTTEPETTTTEAGTTTTEAVTTTTEGEITTEPDTAKIHKATPRANYQIFDECQRLSAPTCTARLCQLIREDNNEERWMKTCAECPEVFPWLGNPLGVRTTKK